MRIRVIVVLAAVLAAHPLAGERTAGKAFALAEDRGYGVDFWREAEGLPQSRIRAITQTRDGYLWLGTDSGVVRFNGSSFTTFTIETGSLKENEVWALKEDDEGGLWIGTYGGGVTLLKNGRFQTFTTADGLPDDVVTRIEKASDGSIWMSTPNGVGRYFRGVFTAFRTGDGLLLPSINTVCACPGAVFAAAGQKLYRFVNGRFEAIQGLVSKDDGDISRLSCDSGDSFWIGYTNAVVKQWDHGKVTTYRWQRQSPPQVTLLYQDALGTVWTALGKRLYWLREGRFEAVPFEDGRTELGVVYSLWVDREQSIWAGLQTNGLARLRIRQLSALSAADGLPNDSTRSVFEDRTGSLWIGTATGLAEYRQGKIRAVTEVDGEPLGPVRSFAEDAAGNLWFSAGSQLLVRRNGRLSRFEGWTGQSEIAALYRDRRGRMWIGSDGEGLLCYENGKFRSYRASDGLTADRVRAIFEDNSGAIWVGSFSRGVSRYQNGKFTNFTTRDGLASDRVYAIHEDQEGAIWFATRAGLSRLKMGKFFTFTAESGLDVNFVYSILDDGRGSFWFTSAQGLFRVSQAEMRGYADGRIRKVTPVGFGVRDGMKTRAFNVGNQPVAWKTAAGLLAFSSMIGVVVVDPKHLSSTTLVPPVYIEKVLVNRSEKQPDQKL